MIREQGGEQMGVFGPEGIELEYKRERPSPRQFAKDLVAFANTRGGRVVLGVTPTEHTVVGVPAADVAEIEEWVSNVAGDLCAPIITPHVQTQMIEDKILVVVRVYPGSLKPYRVKGEPEGRDVYVRIGSTSRPADAALVTGLEREREGRSFDADVVPGATLDDLAPKEIEAYVAHRKRVRGEAIPLDGLPLLRTLRVVRQVNGRFEPNLAGVLLYGRDPQAFFPHAFVQAARFKGSSTDIFLDRRDIGGTIRHQLEEAMHFVRRNVSLGGRVEGLRRADQYEYPLVAVREILVNALVHRDYRVTGQAVRLGIFDDRIEVTSPGLLPVGVSIRDLGTGLSEFRNRILGHNLREMGYVEEWGRGTRIAREEMLKAGLPAPEYRELGRSFQVVLHGPKESTLALNDRQRATLRLLQEGGTMTTREHRDRYGISQVTASRDLGGLVETGLVVRRGQSRNTYYESALKRDLRGYER